MYINKYDPRLKNINELEETFVCGENILNELLKELKPAKGEELTNQSWIITGPRGAGKSHLLVLLYRRIKADKALSRYWQPLSFSEELFDVDSLYRLLLRIFGSIFDNGEDGEEVEKVKNRFMKIKKIRLNGNLKQKQEKRHSLTKDLLALLNRYSEVSGKKLVLMLENLQLLFRDQLSEDDLKNLRGFMNESPAVFIIIGTALSVFDELDDYGRPFYHFFRLRSIESLDRKGIIGFLTNIANFRKDEAVHKRIESNRHYIYVYRLLTGGNPRLVLFLYELLLDSEKLDTEMILAKITELTPYFLDKIREVSSQRKLILNALATESPAQTATEIAEYINEDQKSITEQLKRLAAEGWVKEIPIRAEGVKAKEVFYTLRDYFYRIWYQVRTMGIEESDVYCMAELAAILFDREELEKRTPKNASQVSDHHTTYLESVRSLEKEAFVEDTDIRARIPEKMIREKPNIIAKILAVVKNQNTREAQKLMAEPLFAEIVKKLSKYQKGFISFPEIFDLSE